MWVLALLFAAFPVCVYLSVTLTGRAKPAFWILSCVSLSAFFNLLMQRRKSVHRRWRIEHGLCPECAYPVGESPVCTECGTPVKHGATERA
jgi:hypothetical protein